jgi:hypothetical protein
MRRSLQASAVTGSGKKMERTASGIFQSIRDSLQGTCFNPLQISPTKQDKNVLHLRLTQ